MEGGKRGSCNLCNSFPPPSVPRHVPVAKLDKRSYVEEKPMSDDVESDMDLRWNVCSKGFCNIEADLDGTVAIVVRQCHQHIVGTDHQLTGQLA